MTESTYRDILRLRARRRFRPEPLPEGVLERILEVGRWTGSSKNRQSWAMIVVTDPDRIEALAACGDYMTPVRNAPVTIALVQEPDGYEFDTGRLAQNLMLAAGALGVGSCPVTIHRDDAAREVLGLGPAQRCRYAVALGIPEDGGEGLRPRTGGGRLPLDELVHCDRHGPSG